MQAIKKLLPIGVRDFLWMRKRDLLFFGYLARRAIHRIRYRGQYRELTRSLQQHLFTFNSAIKFGSPNELPGTFERLGIRFRQGRHAAYLHHESDIRKISPRIVRVYPDRFGLKIIKSSEQSPDGTPYYTSSKLAPSSSRITMRAVGSIREKMVISNILSLRHVAPRVYDIIKLRSGETDAFAMVVQHVQGPPVTGQTGVEFIRQFKQVLQDEGFDALGEKEHPDYLPPDFGGNIASDSTGTYYVDIQNFAVVDSERRTQRLVDAVEQVTHFGDSRLFRPEKYAYQSVPGLPVAGKRDSLSRVSTVQTLLHQHKIDLQEGVVLDVGCNLGVFIMHFLSQGARWCVGLDTPEISQVAARFLFERGFSRFDMIGCDLRSQHVTDMLPLLEYDLILYLSVEKHIGFPAWLDQLSFRFLLYEGHAGESIADVCGKVNSWSPRAEIVAGRVSEDGDSGPRPMLLCRCQGG